LPCRVRSILAATRVSVVRSWIGVGQVEHARSARACRQVETLKFPASAAGERARQGGTSLKVGAAYHRPSVVPVGGPAGRLWRLALSRWCACRQSVAQLARAGMLATGGSVDIRSLTAADGLDLSGNSEQREQGGAAGTPLQWQRPGQFLPHTNSEYQPFEWLLCSGTDLPDKRAIRPLGPSRVV